MTEILGWIATILFSLCYIPQMIKTIKTRTTYGLSVWLLVIAWIANVVALIYATLIGQPPLQIKYIAALVFDGMCIFLYWRYK